MAEIRQGWPTAADLAACGSIEVTRAPKCPVCGFDHPLPPITNELGACAACGQCLCECDELDQLAADEAAAKS
jgi:hypothetical protein